LLQKNEHEKKGEHKAEGRARAHIRRNAALKNSFTVPYCVGSVLLSAAENKVVNTFGKLQPAINAVSEAKLNALRNVANEFNSTLNRAKSAVENQREEDSAGTV
jgi:hypothetical protein